MAGQFEGFSNLAERRRNLEDRLRRASDPAKRRLIQDQQEQLRKDEDDFWRQTRQEASEGDHEASMFMNALRSLRERLED